MRKAIVTGASEGIGRAFARRLAAEGFTLTLVARNERRLEELRAELGASGADRPHSVLSADLSTPAGLEAVAQRIRAENFELLVNNAGFGRLGRFSEVDASVWSEMIALNVSALTRLSHEFMRKARKGDGIINVSSTLSFLPMPIQAVYSATKFYVTAFTESLWYEGRKRGIAVVNLCPGITATEFNARAGGTPNDLPKVLTQTPDEVVAVAMRTYLRRGGPTVISGWKNGLLAFLARLLSRRQVVMLMGRTRQ